MSGYESDIADLVRTLAEERIEELERLLNEYKDAECRAVKSEGEALKRVAELEDAAKDALSGWRYIRQNHGDLYGVGWDRVEDKLSKALEE